MGTVLAIEPDPQQAVIVKQVIVRRLHADALMAVSAETALAVLAERVPDLVLVSTLLSPRDSSEIDRRLRSLDETGRIQVISIPLMQRAESPRRENKPRLLKALKRRPSADTGACLPDTFAEEIRPYLERALERKRQSSRGPDQVADAEAPATCPPPPPPRGVRLEPDLQARFSAHEPFHAEPHVEPNPVTAPSHAEPPQPERIGDNPEHHERIIDSGETAQATRVAADPTPPLESFVTLSGADQPSPRLRRSAETLAEAEAPPLDSARGALSTVARAQLPPVSVAATPPPPLKLRRTDQPRRGNVEPIVESAVALPEPILNVEEPTAEVSGGELWEPLFERDPTPALEYFVDIEPFVVAARREVEDMSARDGQALVVAEPEPVVEERARDTSPARGARKRAAKRTVIEASVVDDAPDVFELTASPELEEILEHITAPQSRGLEHEPTPPEPAAAQPAPTDWMARELQELRARIEELRADREAETAALTAHATPPPVEPPTRPSPRLQPIPLRDEWGIYDPERCGFAALLARVNRADVATPPAPAASDLVSRAAPERRQTPRTPRGHVTSPPPRRLVSMPRGGRVAPLSAWARTERIFDDPIVAGRSNDILAGLRLPLPVASVTRPTGCRIRRVRIAEAAAPAPAAADMPRIVILSKRVLDQIRQERAGATTRRPEGTRERIA